MKRIEADSFGDAIRSLDIEHPGVAVLDSDYTLRSPHVHAMHLRFGEIPRQSLEYINCLVKAGWAVCVVTNQPKEGHQIARFLGNLEHHPYFPDSLNQTLGKDHVFGGNLWFCIPGHHYKKSSNAVTEVKAFLDKCKNCEHSRVVMIGDKETDEQFAQKLGVDLFVKLPDSAVMTQINKLPQPFKRIVSNLMP
jgi:histidinol phosphatase-like enzyme